jgi:hypothetical protein
LVTKCGFDNQGGASGIDLLVSYGPTLLVNIGFDPNFRVVVPMQIPISGITGVRALVDTGAAESCIDSLLASQLNLPIVDRRPIAGVHGSQEANMHLAQVYVPSLNFTIYGAFAGVHLTAGGQFHRALIGRTFLRSFTMVYEGRIGTVTLSTWTALSTSLPYSLNSIFARHLFPGESFPPTIEQSWTNRSASVPWRLLPEYLLIKVPEKMKRFDTNVSAVESALQERPEIFHRVGIDIPIRILNGMVDDGMLEVAFSSLSGFWACIWVFCGNNRISRS